MIKKFSKISSYFFSYDYLREGSREYENPGRRFKIFQNLCITCGLKILINHEIIGASLYID